MIDTNALGGDACEHGGGGGTSRWNGWRGACVSALLLSAAACGSDGVVEPIDEQPPEVPVSPSLESDSIVVPVAGGTFTALDGDVELRIPPGALSSGTTITVTRDSTVDASGRAVSGGVLDLAPDGLEFDRPVELIIHLDPSRLSETDVPELVRLHRFADGEPQLIPGGRLDRDEALVTGFIEGFSAYGGARAEVEEIVDANRALAESAEAVDPVPWAEFQETVVRDVETVLPLIDADCREATFLGVKERFFRQRVSLTETLDLVGLDAALVPSRGAFCGGLLAPGASAFEFEPGPWVRVEPGEQVELSASVLDPQGKRLFGTMLWSPDDDEIADIALEGGLLLGVKPGTTWIDVESVDFPLELVSRVEVVVAADLLVEVEPPEPVLATGQRLQVAATVTDTAAGSVLSPEEVSLAWTIGDGAVLASPFVPGAPDGTLTLEGVAPGTTSLTACVSHRDEASGRVTEHSCSAALPVKVVYSVAGEWIFEESLTVDVEPPASETCDIVGTAQLDQDGMEVTGTISEQATCTYDPGDGSEPESQSFTAEGRIFQGSASNRELEFVTEVTLPGGVVEQCRWTGIFDGADGVALVAVGFIQCLDENGFLSEGPSEGRRTNADSGVPSTSGSGWVQRGDGLGRPLP